MRIIFMGSAEIACPALSGLVSDRENKIIRVITQPDRPKGRSLKTLPGPVRKHAEAGGLPVTTPENINTPESVNAIRELKPDILVVVAYGQILHRTILEIPAKACINLHMSLLPRYRGAAPIQWAIVNGERTTGVTTMHINEKMDAGDIIYQDTEPILDEDTAGSLHDRLSLKGAELLKRTVRDIRHNDAPRHPQDHKLAIFAPKIRKKDARIDWTMNADVILRYIKGFNPSPVCHCKAPSGSLRIFSAQIEQTEGAPGRITNLNEKGPLVQTGKAGLRLTEVQPEGRKRMSGREYVAGYRLAEGNILT